MKFTYIFQILAILIATIITSPAYAESNESPRTASTQKHESFAKYGKYIWGAPTHTETQMYLNEAKIPHNSQWADDTWTPQNWIDARGGSAMAVINGLYAAGIVKDQYVKTEDVPVLAVGQPFLELSELEKRRVVAFFDHVFKITTLQKDGTFRIELFGKKKLFGLVQEKKLIGIFNAGGLHLQ